MLLRSSCRPLAALVVLPFAVGCADLLGLGAYESNGDGGTTSAGGTTSSGGSGAGGSTSTGGTATGGSTSTGGTATGGSTSTGGTATGGSTGTGGTATGGGTGTGGSMECTPLSSEPCAYTGPAGTENVGACKAGSRDCNANGIWGPCSKEIVPIPELCADAVDQNCDGFASCNGGVHWVKLFGSTGDQAMEIVAATADGGLVAAGKVSGTINFGAGDILPVGALLDTVVVRLDAFGNQVWAKRIYGQGNQIATALAVDAAGNVAVTGTFDSGLNFGDGALTTAGLTDIFLALLDGANGAVLWKKTFGGTGDEALRGLAVLPGGDLVATGTYGAASLILDGIGLAASSDPDVFIARFSGQNGAAMWAKGFPAPIAQEARDVAVGPDGNLVIVLTGSVPNNIVLGGGLLAPFGGNSDVLVAKYKGADGAHLWSHIYGGAGDDYAHNVAILSDNSVVVGGHTTGNFNWGGGTAGGAGAFDIEFWKLASDGTSLWNRRFGDAQSQFITGLAIDHEDNIVLSGAFLGETFPTGPLHLIAAGTDRYFAKLTKDADFLWTHAYPNATGSFPAVAVTPMGDILFASLLTGTTNFGMGDLTSFDGFTDILLGHFGP